MSARWLLAVFVAVLFQPTFAFADASADLGVSAFSQRVVTELVQRRAQAAQCANRPLPKSPPVGTGWPVSCKTTPVSGWPTMSQVPLTTR